MNTSGSTRSVRSKPEAGRDPLQTLDAPLPGVAEVIELYEAAMRHYAPAAAHTSHVSRISSTSTALAADFPG